MSAELARALRALDDIKKIETQGVRVAELVAGRLRQGALRQYATGQKFFAGKIIMDQLLPVLMKAMVVGHAAGARRSELLRQQSRIKLAIFDDVLKTIKARKKLDVEKLLNQYEVQAFKVLTGVSTKADEEIQATIDELISSGAPVREATRTLGATFEKLGIAPGSTSRLETIFRTQLQTSFGAGRWQADQDPDIQEILWGYKYVTVGDERVREEHAALEGVTLPKEDPFWLTFWPPNGWNCRCQAIPVFEERAVKRPQPLEDGTMPRPDAGFGFNAGEIFDDASMEFGWVPLILDFNEEDHPRNAQGEFTSSGGSGGSSGKFKDKSNAQLTREAARLYKESTKHALGSKERNDLIKERREINAEKIRREGESFKVQERTVVHTKDEAAVKSMLGKDYKKKVASIVGAQDGAKLTLTHDHIDEDESAITVQIDHPHYTAIREISSDGKTIRNVELVVKEKGKGLGTKIFTDQVKGASEHGYETIETTAAGGKEPGRYTNGHYTWARLGYDGKVPREHLAQAREKFGAHVSKVSDLMRSHEGRLWWKENGSDFEATFDLRSNSQSRRVLDEYVKTKSGG